MKSVALGLLFLTQNLLCQNIFNGLQACYPMDGNANNYQSNISALNGSVSNVSQTTGHTGIPQTAWQLNGTTSSYIELPNHIALKNFQVFFSGWFYADSLPYLQYLVYTKSNGCTNNFEAYSLTIWNKGNNQHVFRLSKSDNNCVYAPHVNSQVLATIGNWYHVCFYMDSYKMKLYVNGAVQDSSAHNFQFNYEAGKKVYLGVTNEPNYNLPFKGRIDDVRFYDRDLSPAEINQLYNGNPACTIEPLPVASFSTSTDTICTGQTVSFYNTSTGTPTSNAWQFPGGSPPTSTLSNPVISYNLPGKYNAILNVSNQAGNSSTVQLNSVVVIDCTNLEDQFTTAFEIFPNPTNGVVQLKGTIDKIHSLHIIDSFGRVVKTKVPGASSSELNIDLGDLPKGLYLLVAYSSKGLLRAKEKLILH